MGVGRSVGRGWSLAILVVVLLAALLPAVPASAATPEPWFETRLTAEHWYTALASAEDAQGRLHLAARRTGTDAGIRYLRQVGDGWVEESVSPDGRAWNVAIAVDPDGRPVIAWDHGTKQLRIATRTGDGWTVERVAAKGVGSDGLALAIDADGHRHLAWFGGYDPSTHRYLTDRSGTWTMTNLGHVDPYSPPTLTVTVDGVAWLASGVPYGATNGIQRIRVTRIDGSTVTTKRLGLGWSPRVALDGTGRPIVAWEAQRGVAVERFGDRGWQRLGLLRASTYGLLGLDIRGDRIGVAFQSDLETTFGEAVAVLDATGHWTRTDVARRMTCTPSGIHLLGAGRIALPCLAPWREAPGLPGIGLHTVIGGDVDLRSIASEVRSDSAFAARAPDGHVEILTTRRDGRLVISRERGGGWTDELVIERSPMLVTSFTIGPDGDRAIAGFSRSGVGLLADRRGSWTHFEVGRGSAPQVSIDASGRYHVGYLLKVGSRTVLGVAVGRPDAWERSRIPASHQSRNGSDAIFMVAPDGTDAVVWHRMLSRERQHAGLRLARSGPDGWSVRRLNKDWYDVLWSAAMAPDGTIGIVHGGLSASRLLEIRGSRRTSAGLPAAWFGGDLAYGPDSRASVLTLAYGSNRMFVAERRGSGWHRTVVTSAPRDDFLFAVSGTGPTVILGRHEDRTRDAGWFVLTRPS